MFGIGFCRGSGEFLNHLSEVTKTDLSPDCRLYYRLVGSQTRTTADRRLSGLLGMFRAATIYHIP